VKIRLHVSRDGLASALSALTVGFEVREVSRACPDRPPSPLVRVYVDAEPRPRAWTEGER
jgi:hypothetical protein